MRIQWTKTAKERLEDIETYIAHDSQETAVKIILSVIRKTARQLSRYPQSGKPGRLVGTRELYFSDIPFVVVYTISQDTITIVTVFHTAQYFPET